MKILLVEDNTDLATYLNAALSNEGFVVDHVRYGTQAEDLVRLESPDLVILDRMLPDGDGLEIARNLRAHNVHTPILLLTALGEVVDKVAGLDAGADDYLVKPFEVPELLARVRAIIRRPSERSPDSIHVQDLIIDKRTATVTRAGTVVPLTSKEYAILRYLAERAGDVVNRAEILSNCWEFSYNPFTNIVDVYIRRLRKKLYVGSKEYIQTLRGLGYRLEK